MQNHLLSKRLLGLGLIANAALLLPAQVPQQAGGAVRALTLTPEQAEILSHMSIVYLDDGQGGQAKTVRFSDINVQIVNGLGATNGNPADPYELDPALTLTNGLGNLIVGYQENRP